MAKDIKSWFKKTFSKESIDDAVEKISTTTENAFSSIKDAAEKLYSDVETFYDKEGKPVADKLLSKAKEVTENPEKYAKIYGKRFVNSMKQVTADAVNGLENALEKYHKPSAEELNGKYIGIGVYASEKPVFKFEYDAIVKFVDSANAHLIDNESKHKSQILDDIKKYAVTNVNDLIKLYSDIESDAMIKRNTTEGKTRDFLADQLLLNNKVKEVKRYFNKD